MRPVGPLRLEKLNLRSAKFHECLMVRTNFESADMGGVEVTKCDATKARFDSGSLES